MAEKNKKASGLLLVCKPAGWTSFDVCAKLRGILGTKKVGHTGTLDPFATGLLIIAFGKMTKLIPYFEKDRKTYRTKILFGKTSETLDPESEIILDENFIVGTRRGVSLKKNVGAIINRPNLEKILAKNFQGKIFQSPPKYSAIKINGKRAYDLARQGKEFEMKKRKTEIFSTKVLEVGDGYVEIELEVAAGFYIRSFARDLAKNFGTVGMCETLERISIGRISSNPEKNSLKILDLKNFIRENDLDKKNVGAIINRPSDYNIQNYILDPQKLLTSFPQVEIEESRFGDFSAGRSFDFENVQNLKEGEKFLVTIQNKSIGMGELKFGKIQPRILF